MGDRWVLATFQGENAAFKVSWVDIWKGQMSRFSHDCTHDSLDSSLQTSMPYRLSLNSRYEGNFVAESAGENLIEALVWKEMQLMPNVHCPSFIYYICLCDERWSSHQRLRCGSLPASSWWLGRPLFPALSQSPPFRFYQLPLRTPAGGGVSLSPRHLWVSPDGGKASGNERQQPILSERIRTAVYHGTDLQGVCACVTLSTTDLVCKYVHIKSLTHREWMWVCAYVCSSMQGVLDHVCTLTPWSQWVSVTINT